MADLEATEIRVAYPEASELNLKIRVGACHLEVTPGGDDAWASGTYRHPSGALLPRIEQQGGMVTISQEYSVAALGGLFRGIPRFDLALGKARPYMLTVVAGASESNLDLGGLPISHLSIKQGAGKAAFDFSRPNPQAMTLLSVDAGAVSVEMSNLANAGFAEMTVQGGAASCRFDFGGSLQRDGHVRVTAGMSSVEIRVPASTAAKIRVESVMGGVDVGDGFTKKEGAFWTGAAVAGGAPVLTIDANISLGSMAIRAT